MIALVYVLDAVLMMAFALGLGVILARRFGLPWRLYGIGALTFVGSQVLHIPFNRFVLEPALVQAGWLRGGAGVYALAAIALGLSAGLFEELARFGILRLWLREVRSWPKALMYGAGHGGVEAIILGGLVLLGLVQALTLRDVDLSTVVPPEQLEAARAQLEAFWNAPWYLIMLGAAERAFALVIHLAATVLVVQAVRSKNMVWLILAILWHTVVDAVAVFGVREYGALATEALIFGMALLGLLILFRMRTSLEEPDAAAPQAPSSMERLPEPEAEVDSEKLDDSRYS